MSTCDLAMNYTGFAAVAGVHVRFSNEIAMVSLPPELSSCDIARNYIGLGAIGLWSVPGGSENWSNRPRAGRRPKVLRNDHSEEGNHH